MIMLDHHPLLFSIFSRYHIPFLPIFCPVLTHFSSVFPCTLHPNISAEERQQLGDGGSHWSTQNIVQVFLLSLLIDLFASTVPLTSGWYDIQQSPLFVFNRWPQEKGCSQQPSSKSCQIKVALWGQPFSEPQDGSNNDNSWGMGC